MTFVKLTVGLETTLSAYQYSKIEKQALSDITSTDINLISLISVSFRLYRIYVIFATETPTLIIHKLLLLKSYELELK